MQLSIASKQTNSNGIMTREKEERLPFKLGLVELGDGETIVNIGIHCRLLLTEVGR